MPRPRKPRPVNEEESALFASTMADARPLKKTPGARDILPDILNVTRRPNVQIRPRTHPPVEDRPAPAIRAKDRAALSGMDGKNAERLARGKLEIEARLDLHGHRQDTAQRELLDFIRRNHAYGKRCVLVITGKGRSLKNQQIEDSTAGGRYVIAERKGVLFDLVPEWLAGPGLAPYVVAFTPAQPRHGGSGALYVYLRRERG
ncbi:MAG: Smr/MutS family protein [Pseudomonadota bacterium]